MDGEQINYKAIRVENKIELKEDFEIAALKVYPEEWQEFDNGFRVDHNASKRNVAEEVFKHVFNALKFDNDLAEGVACAFLRRYEGDAPADKLDASVKMATALTYAVIKIRDGG